MNSIRNRVLKQVKQYYYKNKFDWNNVEVFFIVGTGRTATHFLANFFQENYRQKVLSIHEPQPDLLVSGLKHHRKKISTEKFINYIKLNRSLQCKAVNESHSIDYYIESNNNLSVSLNVLNEFFPKLKFIHIVRDPKTFVVSSMNKINFGNNEYTMYSDKDYRPRLTLKDFEDDLNSINWDHLSQFEKVCWYWFKYNDLILNFKSLNNNIITIKYEDVFFNTEKKEINKIIDFIGLPRLNEFKGLTLDTKFNTSKKVNFYDYKNWEDDQKSFFHGITDNMSSKLGYRE